MRKIMKYETPELTAINAADSIQHSLAAKLPRFHLRDRIDPMLPNEPIVGYADWE